MTEDRAAMVAKVIEYACSDGVSEDDREPIIADIIGGHYDALISFVENVVTYGALRDPWDGQKAINLLRRFKPHAEILTRIN